MKNPQIIGAPELGPGQLWEVAGYVLGRNVRQSPRTFDNWDRLEFLGVSGSYYHFLGNGKTVLVCVIKITKQ